ncbi:uncharacterized protein LOC110382588 isoform X2 [Helicoverpa armigera]|uniref:uncharacterized protein LOC110382588 isoform X2 n=1 Tax=Helicoverpa armigera TaxID=29058 RepID=UPI0030831AE8
MNMFRTMLNSIPKNRSEYVEDLEIPEITLTPYEWLDPEEPLSLRSESLLTDSLAEIDRATYSTDSSIPLSRAMTDSEIDYGFYKRYNRLNYTDTWDHLRDAVNAFPPDYMASLNSYISLEPTDELEAAELRLSAELAETRRRYNEEWRRRIQRQFDDCCVYEPDDPGLWELRDALRSLDMKVLDLKALEADLASIRPRP